MAPHQQLRHQQLRHQQLRHPPLRHPPLPPRTWRGVGGGGRGRVGGRGRGRGGVGGSYRSTAASIAASAAGMTDGCRDVVRGRWRCASCLVRAEQSGSAGHTAAPRSNPSNSGTRPAERQRRQSARPAADDSSSLSVEEETVVRRTEATSGSVLSKLDTLAHPPRTESSASQRKKSIGLESRRLSLQVKQGFLLLYSKDPRNNRRANAFIQRDGGARAAGA